MKKLQNLTKPKSNTLHMILDYPLEGEGEGTYFDNNVTTKIINGLQNIKIVWDPRFQNEYGEETNIILHERTEDYYTYSLGIDGKKTTLHRKELIVFYGKFTNGIYYAFDFNSSQISPIATADSFTILKSQIYEYYQNHPLFACYHVDEKYLKLELIEIEIIEELLTELSLNGLEKLISKITRGMLANRLLGMRKWYAKIIFKVKNNSTSDSYVAVITKLKKLIYTLSPTLPIKDIDTCEANGKYTVNINGFGI